MYIERYLNILFMQTKKLIMRNENLYNKKMFLTFCVFCLVLMLVVLIMKTK